MGNERLLRLSAHDAGGVYRFAISLAAILAAITLAPNFAHAAHHHRLRHSSAPASAATPEPYAEACVMEPTSGTVIFEKNDHQPWPTASLAKMMLMLIVAQKLHDGSLKPTDQIATSVKAAKMGGSQVYLKDGETFSLDDMMKAVVVHSANDASVAVAEYVAGSTEAFVTMMNQQAARLGMKDTHYYSVHGLPPGRGQNADVASAYDQALLARALLAYPDVLRWSSIDTAPFRNGTFVLRNTNHLVRTFQGCDGLKTGFYDKAGFNVVATARRGNLRLIAVVLGTPHKLTNFKEAAEMMAAGFREYEMHSVAAKGAQAPGAIAVTGGSVASIKPVFASDATVFIRRDDSAKTVEVAYNLPPSIAAPLKAGQRIGTAEVTRDGKAVATVALVAPADVPSRPAGIVGRILGKL
ncbi:MAG TPA: D-alanyl-D-alanine carboxypeptidase family protein [Candidatus Binataceae bacterium]|nr:D-alanyl-D-alanine carboxypeptidase family protein [Candidatus Binataceae bacterium]